ncbi:hypothetical protein AEAC466_16710 [Asticcacaulis sp. AC466]|uniref:BadF/BadG/BcrA/BcrD ATPase family protein n=1 Tax=Asticcacaulis sp. AC466 TaxID=1282362 RepID=UPI0003C40B1B|nr:BadF/BadG/BcrA/BcrD ATPase family protein [Asticcacaulis sp. AC466]ESQ82506.1 hypothetical protein AEAC466_16710 [Asticcacaulis sp. AC466]
MTQDFPGILYLGVDGGGTRSRARLQDSDGKILGEGQSGPANIRLGLDLAWNNILAAIDVALTVAGLDRSVLSRTVAVFGLAGIVTEDDVIRVKARANIFNTIAIWPDYHIAAIGAFEGADGGVQIAGTGSSGYAVIDGKGHTLGGWGFSLSEKGSAAALGRDAIRTALEASDGLVTQTPFTKAVIAHFGDPAAIVDWSETALPMDYGALSPLVFRYAKLRDPVATSLLRHLAADCGRFIQQLVYIGAPKVCFMGGLASLIRPWLPQTAIDCLTEPKGDALSGALHLAKQLSHVHAAQTVDA